jgi:hypothetical protein
VKRAIDVPASVQGRRILPRYLDERDHPWLATLLEEYERFADRPRRELHQRLQQSLAADVPEDKRQHAGRVLGRLCQDIVRTEIAPRKVREVLFREAAAGGSRAEVIARASRRLGVSAQVLQECLLADLGSERPVGKLPDPLGAPQLALQANLALVQRLLGRASRVEIAAWGGARDLVRHARLRGLLVTVRPWLEKAPVVSEPVEAAAQLELSGPYALFRRTLVYGRALASLVPRLAWCDRFELRATCQWDATQARLELRSGDPFLPSSPPRRFDSKLEQRFARDFARAAPDWELVREPEPIPVHGTLLFPDFAVHPRGQPERRWLIELVGFWTRAYLDKKLQRLRAAGIERLILCIDAERACSDEALPPGAHILRYRRRVDVHEVLRALEEPPRTGAGGR